MALERAKFDLIMLGDSLAVPGSLPGRMDAYLRYAEHAPFHDPSPLVAIMASATRRIGLAATLSTTFYPPFLLARLMTTLDHLSRGRIAWNVVTSYKIEEALNFGYEELLDHDQRYDRADEYMELCYRLWSARGSGRGRHGPARRHLRRFHEGAGDRLRGHVLPLARPPQRHPVAAGASRHHSGRRLEGAGHRGPPRRGHHRFPGDGGRDEAVLRCVQGPGEEAGARPRRVKVFFLSKPIIGDSDEAAQRRADELYANAPVEAGLASLSTMLQVDLSTYDLDKPLPAAIQTRAIQGIRSQLDRFYMSGRTPTLRDIATRKVSIDSRPYIGSPERVADELARTIDAVGGDGFAIRQGIWPGYVGPFVEKVIPLLQQRGAVRAEYTGTTLREHLRESLAGPSLLRRRDRRDRIAHEPGRGQRGNSGDIPRRHEFDEIESHDAALRGETIEELEHLPVEQTARRAREDGG